MDIYDQKRNNICGKELHKITLNIIKNMKKLIIYIPSYLNTLLEREREIKQIGGGAFNLRSILKERLEVGRNIISSLSSRGVLWRNLKLMDYLEL